MNKQQAYLTAYTPTGTLKYKTYNFEEVYKFKKLCKEKDIPHAVRFRNVKPTNEYIVNKNKIVKTVKDFIHWFAFR